MTHFSLITYKKEAFEKLLRNIIFHYTNRKKEEEKFCLFSRLSVPLWEHMMPPALQPSCDDEEISLSTKQI